MRCNCVHIFIALVFFSSCPSFAQTSFIKEIHLTPHFNNKGNAISMGVNYSLYFTDTAAVHDVELFFDKMQPFLERKTDVVTDLKVTDDNGAVALKIADDVNKYDAVMQHWVSTRAVTGVVAVTYVVPVAVPFPVKRGPHIDLQAAGGGLCGAFNGFLLIPALPDTINIRIIWHLPNGQMAVTTFGVGDCTIKSSRSNLLNCQFMAGPLFSYPAGGANKGFGMYALGRTKDEMDGSIAWPEKAYEQLRRQLNGSADESFRFFIRTYDGGPLNSGVATNGSFLIYLPASQQATDPELKSLIAHEMVHAFLLGLSSKTEGLDDWYNEGIADYLAIKIPYTAGLYSKEYYATLINKEAALYYTNIYRETPEKDFPTIKWSGRNAWSLGYSRGAIYFANLDAKLRRLTTGKVSVISLVNAITALNKQGVKADDSTWVQLIRKDAGEWAVDDWKKMMSGKLMVPEPDAYPGWEPHKIQIGFFDMGFSLPKSIRAGQHIKGLEKNSPAALAGLQEGDEIATTITINDAYVSYTKSITITVQRDSKLIPITFKPYQGNTEGIEWLPVK
jgi:hypothetical protein